MGNFLQNLIGNGTNGAYGPAPLRVVPTQPNPLQMYGGPAPALAVRSQLPMQPLQVAPQMVPNLRVGNTSIPATQGMPLGLSAEGTGRYLSQLQRNGQISSKQFSDLYNQALAKQTPQFNNNYATAGNVVKGFGVGATEFLNKGVVDRISRALPGGNNLATAQAGYLNSLDQVNQATQNAYKLGRINAMQRDAAMQQFNQANQQYAQEGQQINRSANPKTALSDVISAALLLSPAKIAKGGVAATGAKLSLREILNNSPVLGKSLFEAPTAIKAATATGKAGLEKVLFSGMKGLPGAIETGARGGLIGGAANAYGQDMSGKDILKQSLIGAGTGAAFGGALHLGGEATGKLLNYNKAQSEIGSIGKNVNEPVPPMSDTIKKAENDYATGKISGAKLESIRNQEAKATPPNSLPQNHEAYFNTEKADATVPVDKLVSSKTPQENAKGAANAEKFMKQAAEGKTPKRDPIQVTPNPDGTYRVLDGNATTTTAKAQGWKDLPVRIVDPKHVAGIEDMLARANKVDPVFQSTAKGVADKLGLDYQAGPVKQFDSTFKKVINDYGGDVSRLKDSVRGTALMSDPANIQKAIEGYTKAGAKLTSNLYDSTSQNVTGYKDAKVIITMPDGHRGEVIISTPEMAYYKENGGHDIYKKMEKTSDAAELAKLQAQSRAHYAQAEAATAKRLAASAETTVPAAIARPAGNGLPVSKLVPKTVLPSDATLTGTPSTSKNVVAGVNGLNSDMNSIPLSTPSITRPTPKVNAKSLTPKDIPNRERGFTTSVKKSENYSPELKTAVEKTTKIDNSVSDKQAMDNASARAKTAGIDTMHQEALKSLNGDKVLSKQDIVNAGTVLNHLDAAGRHDEAQALHNLLAEKGTAGGQQSQAYAAILKRNPNGILYDGVNRLTGNGVKVTPDMHGEMAKLRDGIAGTKPDTVERARAEGAMEKYVASKLPSSSGDKIFALWRSGLLTGARTLGKIGTSHTFHGVAEGLTNVAAAPIDRALSLFTGKRSGALTGEGLGRGFKEGANNAAYYLGTGIETNPHTNTAEFRPGVNFGVGKDGGRTLLDKMTHGASSKVLNTYTQVGRLHGAMYQPFNEAFRQNEVASLGHAYAANAGLKGAEAKSFIENFKKNPESQAAGYAKTRADTATFQQETQLGKIASTIQQKGGVIGKVIAPFTRIPSAIATDVFNYSPVGAAKVVIDGIRAAKSSEGWTVESQRTFTQGLGRSIVGTAAIAPGILLYSKGMMNLGYPTDPKEQKLWQAEGRTANSVLVGGKWRSLGSLGPVGSVLEIGGTIAASTKKGDDAMTATYKGLLGAAQSVSEQSYLAGTNSAINAVKDPGRYGGKLVNQLASSLVPTLVGNTAQATDKVMRRIDGPVQAIKNAIPGARQTLPVKNDSFGNPQPTPQLGNPLAAFDAFYSSNVRNKDNPQINELRRLQDNGQGAMPTTIKKVESIGAANIKLNPDQTSSLQKLYGQKVQSAWNDAMQTPAYKQADDVGKQKLLENIAKSAEQQAKAEFARANMDTLNSQVQKPGDSINPAKLIDKPFQPGVPKAPAATTGTPPIPSSTHTTYDSKTNNWTQTNSTTGKVIKIDASGNRTVVNPGTQPKSSSTVKTTYDAKSQTWTQTSSTGRVVTIDQNGNRTVVKQGTSRVSTGRSGAGRKSLGTYKSHFSIARSGLNKKFATVKGSKRSLTPKTSTTKSLAAYKNPVNRKVRTKRVFA